MPATTSDTSVTVREIRPGEPLNEFIDLEWTINRSDPNWISPLRMSVKAALNREKHPFHQHAEVAYFVAERGGRVVGRIAAIVNRLHNDYHDDRVGFFGLVQFENHQGTADALFDRSAEWLRERGMTSLRGPVNFSTNEEVASPGLLIEGFEHPPVIMMSHNPPYYAQLHERAGFSKAKDLVALLMDDPDAPPERGVKLVDRLLARSGVTVRPLDLKRFRAEIDAIKGIYNSAWSKNWGFVPMTEAEFEHSAKEFRPVVDADLCLIAEAGEEPVGFSLALPDLNEALRHLPDGRLLPFGWAKLLWYKNRVRGIRVLTLGFKPHLHKAGLGQALYHRKWRKAVEKGYVRGEASWLLEDNNDILRAIERLGGRQYKRYRIYERPC